MSGTAARSESASPRRKRSLSSLATSDDQDGSDNRLKRASIACVTCRKRKIRCDGGQPSCANCTKHRKIGCTYVRVTPEENLEAKARKRLAREQKAKYAALGIEPPPTLNTGRRRWEYNIRFQQQKLDLTRRRSSSSSAATAGAQPSEPAGVPETLGDYSPEGFSTSTWRVGNMVRQAASHPAAVPTRAETRREYYGQVKPQGGEWAASTTTTRAKYLDSQPGRRASGPVAAYSPYPLTPPMEDYHPGEAAASGPSGGAGAGGGGSGLGMYAAEEGSWMLPPSTSNGGAGASRADPSGSHFSSWQSQRTITVQRVPKSLAQVQHVPVKPAPLLPLLPPLHHHHHQQQRHHTHSEGGPYPSPHGGGSNQQFPTGLPAPVSVQPPPVPLYAPNPTRPARTCSFIQQVGSPAPASSSENGTPHAAPASSDWCVPPPVEPYPPAVQGPSLILSPPDYPQHVFHHQHQHQHQHHHHHDGPRDSPAISAPPMLPTTSWNGSLYATPVMRQVGSFQGDEWSAGGGQQPHSTPDLYSQTGW